MPQSKAKVAYVAIDTNVSAGNFSGDLTEYVTGREAYGPKDEILSSRHFDDVIHAEWWETHGSGKPVSGSENDTYLESGSSEPTPGWINNGYGSLYPDLPEFYSKSAPASEGAIRHMAELLAPRIAQLNEMIETKTYATAGTPDAWTEEACRRALAKAAALIEKSKWSIFPAYMSVGLYVDELPPREVLDEMVTRAAAFVTDIWPGLKSDHHPEIEITGFRYVDADGNSMPLYTCVPVFDDTETTVPSSPFPGA